MDEQRRRGGAATVIAGGLLCVLGSFLPWITITTAFGSINRSGMEGGDGIVTLAVGVVGTLIGAAGFGSFQMPGIFASSPILGSVAVGAVFAYNYDDISQRIDRFQAEAGGFGAAGYGAGLWALAVGAVLLFIGSVVMLRTETPNNVSKATTSRGTRECPFCKEPMARDASVCPHCRRDSEPWILHNGTWWVKRPSGFYYLNDKSGDWVHVPEEEVERQRSEHAARETATPELPG